MPSYSSISGFNAVFGQFTREVETQLGRDATLAQAKAAQKIAEREARRDVGADLEFSGWDGSKLDTQIKEIKGGHLLAPTRFSAGPWTVAQKGRHADGGVGRFQGPGLNMRTGRTSRSKKTGAIVVRRRSAGVRWNGMTRGKNTASRARLAMEKELPKVAEEAVVKVTRKHFG